MPFSVIDLFAGPGGLAEGFSSLVQEDGERVFNIKLSIEKDPFAHQTLTLRSFVRQFPFRQLPEEYYLFVAGQITIEELYRSYPLQFANASNEAWKATLGVTGEEEVDERIEAALGGVKDWVLIGGPPCQAYSNVGRSRVGGIFEEDHRVFLYKEYLRIIAKHHPAVFVMENVEGLLSARLNGERIFEWILRDLANPAFVFNELESPGYRIYSLVKDNVTKDSDYLIKAEHYGIPQKRHRVILIGIREDVRGRPRTLSELSAVTLESVIGLLPKIRSGISKSFSHCEEVRRDDGSVKKKRYYLRQENSFDNWSRLIRNWTREFNERLGVGKKGGPVLYPESSGMEFLETENNLIRPDHPLAKWYTDRKLSGITHHVSRTHLTQDLRRYLFASLYTRKNGKFPKLNDYKSFDESLLPNHENADSGNFTDRFRVQVPDSPATTVTSHISKDGHYFIHYDSIQCRSLTVREAARIQTFPDNYFFCGSRTEQFHQVGNAVPPFLAYQIATIVREIFVNERAPIAGEQLELQVMH